MPRNPKSVFSAEWAKSPAVAAGLAAFILMDFNGHCHLFYRTFPTGGTLTERHRRPRSTPCR